MLPTLSVNNITGRLEDMPKSSTFSPDLPKRKAHFGSSSVHA